MPNYYYANKGNDNKKANSMNEGNHNTDYSFADKKGERVEKSSKDLVIDGNSVYEIDPDCYERVKQNRLNARGDWSRR
ncbi:hypothetical protein [Anaerocolumna xylanovorans]|uniref:Uncharacterized protein n=1 Tax=Anaerocolumna xylanovorans DSM 12503 TaxID=1121345 RepID=A0A1M7YF41_9FIRM|nr:hypothetical protein [Anaerocolumna xylanovorans]SHO51201.1 hypothetical protein SAMN02745217_03061 [Anaerocolumna xylanovorans DSM 12503]